MAVATGVQYAEVPVHPALAGFIQLMWTLEVADAASFGPAERMRMVQ